MLRNPKALLIFSSVVVVFVIAVAGGALGNEFNGGFLGAPLPKIQIPAEPINSHPFFGHFKVTNTMVATWVSIILLLILSVRVRSGINEIPGRLQGVFEVILEFFLKLSVEVAGPERARRFFPLVMTIFLFIVTSNWLGILPGFGTIGRIESVDDFKHHHEANLKEGEHLDLDHLTVHVFDGEGSVGILGFGSIDAEKSVREIEEHGTDAGKQAGVLVPFLRSPNTDINTTLAIALISMFLIQWWGFSTLGIFGHLGKFINVKDGPIMFFVGILEFISEIAKVISFTFRLFGNIFAGEVLLVAMMFLIPIVGIIPFLGLELFVGVIQGFICAMLTLVFASSATVSHKKESGH